MDETLQKQIQARFEELPADVQEAIRSSHMDQKLQEIGAKHALHLDQIGELSDEVYLVMLGFSDPSAFPQQLATQLRLPEDKAGAIAKEVSESLFIPIRKSMQQFAEERAVHSALVKEAGPAPVVAPAPAAPIATPAAPSAPAPVVQKAPTPAPTTPSAPIVQPKELHPADMMLSQKTVTVAPSAAAPAASTPAAPAAASKPAAAAPAPAKNEPPAPKPYAADPYREPIS